MTIHVVTPGQTLNSIARQYGLSPGLIARYNGLMPPYPLVVGESLVILRPETVYTVRPGDTLYAISGRFGVSELQLLRNNPNLQGSTQIYPGQVLVISLEDAPTQSIEVNGYAYPYVQLPVLRQILPYTTYLTPFTYGIAADNSLVMLDDAPLISLARQYGVVPLMHLSTLTESGSFSSARAQNLLSNPAAQQQLIDQVMRVLLQKGYGGLDVDFEYIEPEYAQLYADFVGRLRTAVNLQQMELITALAPKTSRDQPGVLYEGHDYALLGQNSDAVLLMTYEWGYTYGPPMAVSPIDSVRRVIEFARTEIPAEKIFMGFPNYAYDWRLPYVAGDSRATLISSEQAKALAVRHGSEISFDEASQTPYFHYTENGVLHEVWFEDARSVAAKLALVQTYNLRGVGYWNFMRPFTTNFSILNAMFRIAQR